MPFDTRGPPSKRGRMDGGYGGYGGFGGGVMAPQQVESELMRVDQNIRPNHIVLLTVLNAQYPIDVHIINKVCQNIGKIRRIVVFKRGAIVQSMVEFDDLTSATNAKSQLHGCDIYSGSCTLKVEYGKTDRLNVKRNTDMTWDYTEEFAAQNGMAGNGSFHEEQPRAEERRDRPVLLNEPPPGSMGAAMGGMGSMGGMGVMGGMGTMGTMGGGMGAMGGGWAGENMGESRGYGSVGGNVDYGARNTYEQSTNYGGSMGGAGGRRGGSVLMIYGLEPAKFNCQRLFNLFCQYGNIVRIMFLKNKEGTAMVELDSPESVNKAIQNLNHVPIFGLKLKLEWSKKEFIEEVKHPHQLCDGSTSYTDFARDRNNRFDTPERAAKNRIIAPTKILHYYNVPKMEDQDMEDIYTSAGATAPTKIKWFPPKSEKSASGLCEFDSAQEACEALVLANHTEIEGTKKYPFCMKLCFSPATH